LRNTRWAEDGEIAFFGRLRKVMGRLDGRLVMLEAWIRRLVEIGLQLFFALAIVIADRDGGSGIVIVNCISC
jgi:hypothetical protein